MSGITVQPASQIAATIRRYLTDHEDFPGCVEIELGEYLAQQAPAIAVWLEEYERMRRDPSRGLARDDEIRQPGFGSIRARTDAAQPSEVVA